MLNDWLCARTVEACARLLEEEADRQEAAWNEYLQKGGTGPATDLSAIPRMYAEKIRKIGA